MENQRWSLYAANLPDKDIQQLAVLTRHREKVPPSPFLSLAVQRMVKRPFINWVLLRRKAIMDVRQQMKTG